MKYILTLLIFKCKTHFPPKMYQIKLQDFNLKLQKDNQCTSSLGILHDFNVNYTFSELQFLFRFI